MLGARDILVSNQELVRLDDLFVYVPHERDLVIDRWERTLRSRIVAEWLIEWKDHADEDKSWENVASL